MSGWSPDPEASRIEQMIDERIAKALEDYQVKLDQLPLKNLQDRLELSWQPNGGVLLEPGSVDPSKLTLEPWHIVGGSGEPPFQNGWVNYDTTHPVAAFRKLPDGTVQVEGLVAGGTVSNGSTTATIFTLPGGYRPRPAGRSADGARHFGVVSNGAWGMCHVFPDGPVIASIGSNVWFDLSSIRFIAA